MRSHSYFFEGFPLVFQFGLVSTLLACGYWYSVFDISLLSLPNDCCLRGLLRSRPLLSGDVIELFSIRLELFF